MRKNQRLPLISIFLSVLLTACFGHAAEGQLSVRTLAVEDMELPNWYLATGTDTYEELKWPVEQPTPPILSTAGQELLLFSKETNAEGQVEYKVSKKLTIPTDATELLVVAWPDDGDEKFGLMVVEDKLKQAKSNDWLVINTSKHLVTLRYGTNSDAIQLEPLEAKPFKIDSAEGKGGASIAQMMLEGELKTFYSTYWGVPEKQRSIVLFYNNDSRVKLRKVTIPLLP